MAINFVNITESDFLSKKVLHKYMPLESALATINGQYMWFANPVVWKDPFEKRFIEAKYGVKEESFPLNGRVFCACLTQTQASEAHWNTYLNGQIGISFSIKRERLLEVLNNLSDCEVYVGTVSYLRTSDIKKKLSDISCLQTISSLRLNNRDLQIKLLLLKRIAFQYENEIRILIVKGNKTQEKGIKIPFGKISSNKLIDRITIDPSVGVQTEKMLKDLFKKTYNFKKVYKSQIYTMLSNTKIDL